MCYCKLSDVHQKFHASIVFPIYTTGVSKAVLIPSKHLDWLVILSFQIHVLTIRSLCLYFVWLWFRLYFVWFWFSVVFVCLGLCFIKIRDAGLQLSVCYSPNSTHSKKGILWNRLLRLNYFKRGSQYCVNRESINFKSGWRS